MRKLIFLFLFVGGLLRNDSLQAQSDEAIKLTRAEKTETYPTTFGTRYFVTPSAIPIEKGQFSLHNTELRILSASYGLTKNISISTGFNLGYIFTDYEYALPFLTSKIAFEIAPKFFIGGGFFTVYEDYSNALEVLGFGMVTLGDRNANITWTYIYDFTKESSLFTPEDGFRVVSPISLSAMYRINKYISLISENHFTNRSNNYLNDFNGFEGIRLIFKRNAIDLGAIVLADRRYSFGTDPDINNLSFEIVPFLGYTFAF